MTERDRILRKLDGYSREFFLLVQIYWSLDDGRRLETKNTMI